MGKSIEQMREAISRCYDSLSWKDKCSRMPTAQVFAVYHRFIKAGKLDKDGRPTRFQQLNKEVMKKADSMVGGFHTKHYDNKIIFDEWLSEQTPNGTQMTIFDFIKTK